MMTNVDAGWYVSPGSDWELFGGEIRLYGADGDCDAVSVHAGSSVEAGWHTVEDDVLSVCSSAASWSCLHGNNLLETCSETYSDFVKSEDDEFDRLSPDDLISSIASCVNDDLPVSLEQFYEINRLIDADAEIESREACHLLLSADIVDAVADGMEDCKAGLKSESCGSDETDVSGIDDYSESLKLGASSGRTESTDSRVASVEYEELYEESVAAEDVPSTISCDVLEDLIASSIRDGSFKPPCHRPPAAERPNCRRLRKKEQNKSAALRYRLKKRSEQGLVLTEYAMLERRNIELRTRLDAMTKEISYLKSLIDELCP